MIELLTTFNRPVGVIFILPLATDDAQSKKNSLVTLAKLARLSSANTISTLIVVDNSKIEIMLGNLPMSEFWSKANKAIAKPLHLFNTLTNQPSQFTSLDHSDFGKILTYGDISLYGEIAVENYLDETALAEAAINSLESGMLASGFDLKQTKIAGILVMAKESVLQKIPAINIHHLYHVIGEQTDQASIYKGVYAIDDESDVVRIYTWFAGLGLPVDRINALKQESSAQALQQEAKEKSRLSGMVLDLGEKTSTAAQQIHQKIKDKNSAFTKLIGNVPVIDKRKK
jgi:cell division GTPase FtsZ